MINRQALLNDLQAVLKLLEADLLDRSESSEVPEVGETLRSEYKWAKDAERTGQSFEEWRSDAITQTAAAWVLSCVFVRFLEDNLLIDPPKIAGPTGSGQSSVVSGQSGNTENRQLRTDDSLQRARDEHEIYFRKSPTETDREYLLTVFDDLARQPVTKDIFGEHNPIRELPSWLSGDAAGDLLRFFQKIDADSGVLVHDFAASDWDTRFLGDLYQDLSESARKKYALLQTPEFVEEFILQYTLEPALDEFGVDAPAIEAHYLQPATPQGFRMIDPACGSGHFLLGAFRRVLDRWRKKDPGATVRELVLRTLESIHGVDINPFAVAIARFRLLLEAMRASGIRRLVDSPPFAIHVACGDSLLHGPETAVQDTLGDIGPKEHAYWVEDLPLLRRILQNRHYHAVVANPPYIVPKDRQLNQRYRRRFASCHRQYSLAVPFMERIFRLAVSASDTNMGGYTGQITANSFMKREFGKKLIEEFLPQVDLTHVIDTSGAYIPGHGTPTVILFGRHRRPVADTIRTVMGITGEPSTPKDPSEGLVWSAIVVQIDKAGSQSAFVSVSDSPRKSFQAHPWALGGAGASELKEWIDGISEEKIGQLILQAGRTNSPGVDECYLIDAASARRNMICDVCIPMVVGDCVRHWTISDTPSVIYPYKSLAGQAISGDHRVVQHYLWYFRSVLKRRTIYGKSLAENGRNWYEHLEHYVDKLRTDTSLCWVEIATHNHFALDRGGKVFKQTAPVMKLEGRLSTDDYLGLCSLLNSSIVCFWLKQVCHNKGSTVDERGARQRTAPFEDFFDFKSTKIANLPIPKEVPFAFGQRLDNLATQWADSMPHAILHQWQQQEKAQTHHKGYLRECLRQKHASSSLIRGDMIRLQEDLDWQCYRLYGLIEDDLTSEAESLPVELGQRAFEIVLARKMDADKVESTWFERHGCTPITRLPSGWPDDYRRLVERRIEVIENNKNVGLIEQPEYKRRWNTEPWDSQLERALREWMLDRLESYFDFDGRMREEVASDQSSVVSAEDTDNCQLTTDNSESPPLAGIQLRSNAQLADVAGRDAQFMEVGELYRDDSAFDVERLVAELVAAENVPLLPVLRYKPSGLRKRAEWETTWELQRQEDAIDARKDLPEDDAQYLTEIQASEIKRQEIGDIPVPPKYRSSDFISTGGARYWHLRGRLDVPKERWVSFPHCEGEDGTLVIAWAGYDHLQLARAVSAYFVDIQERLGGRDDPRLEPLLACLIELLPWLKQWHNDVDPEFNVPMGDYFEGFIQDEARQMNKTVEEVRNWQPPKRKRGAKGQRRKGAKG